MEFKRLIWGRNPTSRLVDVSHVWIYVGRRAMVDPRVVLVVISDFESRSHHHNVLYPYRPPGSSVFPAYYPIGVRGYLGFPAMLCAPENPA